MLETQPKASHFVGGAYMEDRDGEIIDVIYPATGEIIARVHEATPAVQEAAIAAAKAAIVVAADQDETPAEMSDTEKFLWDLQGVSSVAALLLIRSAGR